MVDQVIPFWTPAFWLHEVCFWSYSKAQFQCVTSLLVPYERCLHKCLYFTKACVFRSDTDCPKNFLFNLLRMASWSFNLSASSWKFHPRSREACRVRRSLPPGSGYVTQFLRTDIHNIGPCLRFVSRITIRSNIILISGHEAKWQSVASHVAQAVSHYFANVFFVPLTTPHPKTFARRQSCESKTFSKLFAWHDRTSRPSSPSLERLGVAQGVVSPTGCLGRHAVQYVFAVRVRPMTIEQT